MTRSKAILLLVLASTGCGGGAPLLHPAHVLRPGFIRVGAGVSGAMVIAGAEPPASQAPSDGAAAPEDARADVATRRLGELAVAPGMAPWISARAGIRGDNEIGLTYTGRSVRLDGRHAFSLGKQALSIGLGAAALFADRPGAEADGSGVYGVGFDVPILFGLNTDADLYALWLGPRLGFELLRGRVLLPGDAASPGALVKAAGHHFQLGFVLGARAGFRHVHVALEAGAAYHRATGELGGAPVEIEQGTIAPGGAVTVAF